MPEKYRMYVDGKWVEARSGQELQVVNPADEQVLATVPAGDAQDIDAAVKAARRAFDEGWRNVTAQQRGRILLKLAELTRAHRSELARLECLNNGKPIVEAELDIDDVATCFEYYGGLATKIRGDVLTVPAEALALAIREPVGVAGQIIPWNYPLLMAAWKLAPALAAGCTCVLKPAEQTPLTALKFAELFEQAGLSPGVVNIVTGDGPGAGAPLVRHPLVDKVAFTGGIDTGKLVMSMAAESLKKVSLELGGKSPNIFFADADFEAAVDGALFGVFINQGEVCSAGSRVLVQRSIYHRVLEAMVEKARKIKVGPGLDPATKMGPLVSREQMEKVAMYQQIGKREGAKVALGGGRSREFPKGYFVEPTIFSDVDNNMRIAREEIFGPVVCVIPFEDERDALRLANDTYYGLAAAVWTRDIYRALRAVRELQAGIVWVNHSQPAMVEAPWGGYKMSGFGRELGPWGLEEYQQVKQVYINLSEQPIAWY